MSTGRLRNRAIVLTGVVVLFSGLRQPLAAEPFQGVLIQLDDGQRLSVTAVTSPTPITLGPRSQALIVWSDGEQETWQNIAPGTTWKSSATRNPSLAANPLAGTRGQGQGGGGPSGLGQFTTQMVQLLGTTVFRGKSFVTPHNGALLNPKVTIRRQPRGGDGEQFPAAVAVLKRGNAELAQIPFSKDQQQCAFDQIPRLVEKFPAGLDAGEYTLRIDGHAESATFTIEDREWSARVMERPNQIGDLLASRRDPLFLQVAVETLLSQRDDNDKPLAYLSDALDLLDSVPQDKLTVHLRAARTDLVRRLRGEAPEKAAHSLLTTGIPAIDRARQRIVAGDWNAARDELDKVPNEPRAQALGQLHRAEVLAQSGLGQTAAADGLYRQAIQGLQQESEADRFLAHNNYGNFCLAQAQDRLHNHAFQMAAGVQQPLLTALIFWRTAEANYNSARKLAEGMNANQQAGVQVNAARLQVLLADIIRTLDTTPAGERTFRAGDQAADELAAEMVSSISSSRDSDIDPLIRASAQEIQAHLAFRARRAEACREHAQQALTAYLDAGSLDGVEGIQRLLGLYHRHQAEFLAGGRAAPDAPQLALKHFLISMQLAELLRSRIPPDQFGLSQAGFFARRTYVNEQVIDLLVKAGQAAEALKYAERAKARSLQDLLATRNIHRDGGEEVPTLEETLDRWPEDVTAIEYFLGSERGWVFVIDPGGHVVARELVHVDGTPLHSRELISEVRGFLRDIDGKISQLQQGVGYGDWQHPLHRFHQQLLPPMAMEAARKAKTVVIVPHHILHYLPFTALVIKPDPEERGQAEVPLARFLIDEPFNTCTAPSLLTWITLRNRRQPQFRQVNALGIVEVAGHAPLPGVAIDMGNLRTVFGDRVQAVVEGQVANEPRVKKLFTEKGMLFVATHGHNMPAQPLASFLLCQPDQENEGHLTAAEIFNTDIGASMVIMSACYSGLADQSPLPGDDLFGLQRAFLQSGASTVVAGLWDVYDGTGPLLMREFFKHLADGQGTAAALASAQRTFLKQQREEGAGNPWLHPYFWAVYTTSGDDRTTFAK